jgi:AcrR family transcriptional regulator
MAANRGYNSLSSKSRLRLIEAASDLLADAGYLAITARRVADKAGLKPQLVHYYFRSMEDLVVTIYQRSSATYFCLHDEALSSPHPLRALWELNRNMPEAKRMTEYIALSKQYPKLRAEMKRTGENYRALQAEAIEALFAKRGISDSWIDPETLAILLSAIARNFVIEDEVEVARGHAGLIAFVERILDRFDPVATSAKTSLAPPGSSRDPGEMDFAARIGRR